MYDSESVANINMRSNNVTDIKSKIYVCIVICGYFYACFLLLVEIKRV